MVCLAAALLYNCAPCCSTQPPINLNGDIVPAASHFSHAEYPAKAVKKRLTTKRIKTAAKYRATKEIVTDLARSGLVPTVQDNIRRTYSIKDDIRRTKLERYYTLFGDVVQHRYGDARHKRRWEGAGSLPGVRTPACLYSQVK